MNNRNLYYFTSFLISFLVFSGKSSFSQNISIAREWKLELLHSIRNDFARPPIHARNLFHLSVVMYDAWAIYDPSKETYFLGKTIGDYFCPFEGIPLSENIQLSRETAISYAAYRLLRYRFQNAPGNAIIYANLDGLMASKGFDINFNSQDYTGGNAAALGNYIAAQMIAFGLQDGSNEIANFANQYYEPVNSPVFVEEPGNPEMTDPNRWQQVSVSSFVDQAGNEISFNPPFLCPEWGNVNSFSFHDSVKTTYHRDDKTFHVFHDPGPPAYLNQNDTSGLESLYKWNFILVSIWQSHLDPNDGVMWDISPASKGNIQALPENIEEHPSFYKLFEGGDPGLGYDVNPITGEPYEPQIVPRGDYTRVLAEFWADGPNSETPPGHWFTIYHKVSEHPLFEKKWKGEGEVLDDLEYDVKAYLTLGGAMHDAAIAAWSVKGWYDYARPVSAIRYLAEKGQSSDPDLMNFHPEGAPLIPGFVELVMPGDELAGENDEHVGKIKLFTWRGHYYIEDIETDIAGVGWILAERWWPYQRPNFVTPPFAGYVSGHSTYSRTAAEVMTSMTGSKFFPGGMSNFVAPANEFLEFEAGPSTDIILQWATYQDASDQCSLSRIWGGIHPPVDDIPGRFMGMAIAEGAFNFANNIFESSRPYISQLIANKEVLNINDIGAELIVDITYSEAMKTDNLPSVNYLIDSPLENALSQLNSAWLDEFTFQIKYELQDVEVELHNILIQIDEAESVLGIKQNIYAKSQPFVIDTKRPEILLVQLNETLINDEVTQGLLHVLLSLNEIADTTYHPNLQFISNNQLNETIIYNSTESHWVSETQFRAAYNLVDNNETIDSISLSINNLRDVAGNIQVDYLLENILRVDTKNPLPIDYHINKSIFNLADVGAQAINLNITFDKEMNTNIPPALLFIYQNPLENSLSLNAQNTYWLDSISCVITYNLLNANEEIFDIHVSLSNIKDISGNIANVVEIDNLFSIDTKRPWAQSYIPSTDIISDNNVGTSNFEIVIQYSEDMDLDQVPLVELIGASDLSNSIQYNIIQSEWFDETHFMAKFNITDENIEVDNIDLKISFAKDLAGNTQNVILKSNFISLDTRNPLLLMLSANTYHITNSTDQFVLIAIFDEEMQTHSEPEYEFIANNVDSALIIESSEWLNAFTHKITYSIQDIELNELSIGVQLNNVKDIAGNHTENGFIESLFSIELKPLNIQNQHPINNTLLYPNPLKVGNNLSIKSEMPINNFSLRVYSSDGKLVFLEDVNTNSFDSYIIKYPFNASGIYWLNLFNDDKMINYKIAVIE